MPMTKRFEWQKCNDHGDPWQVVEQNGGWGRRPQHGRQPRERLRPNNQKQRKNHWKQISPWWQTSNYGILLSHETEIQHCKQIQRSSKHQTSRNPLYHCSPYQMLQTLFYKRRKHNSETKQHEWFCAPQNQNKETKLSHCISSNGLGHKIPQDKENMAIVNALCQLQLHQWLNDEWDIISVPSTNPKIHWNTNWNWLTQLLPNITYMQQHWNWYLKDTNIAL